MSSAIVPPPAGKRQPLEARSAATLEFHELVELVLERTGVPIDEFAVAAALESEGLRDMDATARFGNADVFDLAQDVYASALDRIARGEAPDRLIEQDDIEEPEHPLRRFLRFYSRGLFFALPIVLQIGTVVGIRISHGFTDGEATAVMIGSILSFLATGGFSQAIGRLGSTYTSRNAFHLARHLVLRMIVFGMIAAVVFGVVWIVIQVTLHPFPLRIALIALEYHLVLSWLWLSLAVLYMLEKRILVVSMAALWLAIFAVLAGGFGLSVEVAQLPGYAAAATIAAVAGRRLLRRLELTTPASARQERLPRTPILIYGTVPYFIYGVLYFLLLFADRIIGWSTDPPHGYLFYFSRQYELGLDWALISLVLTVAVLEYTIHEFSSVVQPIQRRFTSASLRAHNRAFVLFYVRQVLLFALVAVVSGVGVYWAMRWLGAPGRLPRIGGLFSDWTTVHVFFVGVVAYTLLALGLMNAVILFFLSRPRAALIGLVVGLAAGVAVGYAASRAEDAWFSAFGLLTGTGAFALCTMVAGIRAVRNMDYYYYSAY